MTIPREGRVRDWREAGLAAGLAATPGVVVKLGEKHRLGSLSLRKKLTPLTLSF